MVGSRSPLPRPAATFRGYLESRRFVLTRSHAGPWQFIARSLGDEAILRAERWPDLKAHLLSTGATAAEIGIARRVWRSFERWARDSPSLRRDALGDRPHLPHPVP